jgi:hypothetical protein
VIITTDKKMRPRDPRDFYPTPTGVIDATLQKVKRELRTGAVASILDPGAGMGVWGQVARKVWRDACVMGWDLNFTDQPDSYDHWFVGDYLKKTLPLGVDMVIGNPPYGVAQEFVEQAHRDVRDGGLVVFLLRLAFLEGQARGEGFWKTHRPLAVWVMSRRPSFTGDGKVDATAYAIYIWRKGYSGSARLDWLQWEYAAGDVRKAA